MKKVTLVFVLILIVLVAGAFLVGSWYGQQGAIKSPTSRTSEIFLQVDSTHTSDTLGIAMASSISAEPENTGTLDPGRSSGSKPGTVNISPEKQQIIGVRVSQVEKTSATNTLRTLGRVAPDETRVHRLNAGIQGFIREVSEVTTGDYVKKDQLLATFSSPDAITAIQNYIFALNAMDRLKQGGEDRAAQVQATSSNFQLRLEKLQDLGMSAMQMEEIGKTREVPKRIKILAPADGFVLARNISPNLKFDRGAEWYQISDLGRVWILADVFERESKYIKPGMSARISLSHQEKVFTARVTNVLPQFDTATNTLKVRLETDNPGFVLRPGMFMDIEFLISNPSAITVPADAILDSGLKRTVFVALGDGHFEPREVETGWRFGNRVEIIRGLKAGERIVMSGTFLIDSESRLELAAAGMVGTLSRDPVSGIDVSINKAIKTGRKSSYKGETYYFASDECKAKFDKDPKQFVTP